jgi:hypothetical protein
MTVIQKIFLALFVLFLAVIPVWLYLVVPELLKLPGDYSSHTNFWGTENVYNVDSNDFEGEEIVQVARRVTTKELDNDKIKLNDFFSSAYSNGEIFYKTDQDFVVDRTTKKIQDTEVHFEFPRNVEKEEYATWFYYLSEPFKVKFEQEEKILNLGTYLFSYELEFDATPGFRDADPLVPEMYNVKEVPSGKIWVEPITGIIVKLADEGTDYYVDKVGSVITAPIVAPTFRWTAEYTSDTVANQVRLAQNEKQKIQLYEIWIPILLVLISLAFLIALFASRRAALKRNVE